MTDRDELLGRQLRALDVPEHAPNFFALLAERLNHDVVPDRQKRRRPSWQPPVLVGLAAAVVLAVVAVTTIFTGSDRSGTNPFVPQPPQTRLINATEVRARVSTALSSLRSLSGEVTVECAVNVASCAPPQGGGRTTLRWSFVTTAAGDERITGIGRQDDVSYSAARREQRAITDDGGPRTQVTTNLPAGPPDFAARRSVLRRDVASVVRAFLATTSDVPVTEVTEGERPAWRLVTPVTPNKLAGPGNSGDQLEVIVDRQSGFPLRITETLGTKFLNEVRLSNLVVDGPVDPASFLLELPAGAQPFRQDVGFRSVALDQVAGAVSYAPLLPAPASLPPGYQLAEVTVATQAQPTGSEGGNPPSRRVVSVAYRRGFDRIVVTTRLTGSASRCSITLPGSDATTCWSDPLASGEGFLDNPERYTISSGALTGARAELVISPRGAPHVWTI
ncbi:MAG: hypothetical protein M3137_16845, partial [Actinomycetota bacterium]|nr:hypothetical protein [Actinomycetota bacterium]